MFHGANLHRGRISLCGWHLRDAKLLVVVVVWWTAVAVLFRSIFSWRISLKLVLSSVLAFSALAESVMAQEDDHSHNCAEHLLDNAETSTQISEQVSVVPQMLTSKKMRALKLMVVASGDFTQGLVDSEIYSKIFNAVELANSYLKPLRIVLEVSGIQLYSPGPGDPYSQATQSKNAKEMLNTVKAEWLGRVYPEHDLVAVFGKSAFGNTYGLAFPGTVCKNRKYTFMFVSQGGSSQSAELSFGATLAHEVGHALGISHDSASYPDGPSLMAPGYSANINGFSNISLNQFSEFEMSGGTSCLEEIPGSEQGGDSLSTPQLLEFQGGGVQVRNLKEGDSFREQFRVLGQFPGLTFAAEALPAGANLDNRTGLLTFDASHSLVTGKQLSTTIPIKLFAITFNKRATLELQLNISASNQAPVIEVSSTELIEGQRAAIELRAFDKDLGEKVKFRALNSKNFKTYPGKPKLKLRSSGQGSLDWTPPLGSSGKYVLSLLAQDANGAQTAKDVLFTVNSLTKPAEAPRKEEVVFSENVYSYHLPRVGAEQVSFEGLTPGMFIKDSGASVDIEFAAPYSNASGVLEVNLGNSPRMELSFNTLGASRVVWPGNPQSILSINDIDADAKDDRHFYDAQTGLWQHFSCEGNNKTAQFGGLAGDVPLLFHSFGQAYRAIYRVVGSQGHWLIDKDGGLDIPFGLARDIPFAGDFNADGQDDLALFRASTAEWFVLVDGNVQSFKASLSKANNPERLVPFFSDVDGDLRADFIHFLKSEHGELYFDVLLGSGLKAKAVLARAGFQETVLPIVADMDGDGRSDLGVQVGSSGLEWFSSLSGQIVSDGSYIGSRNDFSFARCDGNVQKLETYILENSVVTLETASLRAALKFSRGAKGDINSDGATDFSLLRNDAISDHATWLTLPASGAISSSKATSGVHSENFSLNLGNSFKSNLVQYANGQWTFRDEQNRLISRGWGIAGDVPVPGDYNGDGKDELAVFRPQDSSWWVLFLDNQSNVVTSKGQFWGQAGDIPVPADYNGDGSTDIAVYRPSLGMWVILYADGQVETIYLGSAQDMPIPADYWGLGAAVPAVYRASTGDWIIRLGDNLESIIKEQWGSSKDIPVSGDFDGNGRQDLAIYRPSEGNWYVKDLSENGYVVVQFGIQSDSPVAAWKTSRVF